MLWRNLSFVLLVLLPILGETLATPVGSEHYSVEEQDPAEQTVTVDDKDYANDKPVYEWQLAIWPEDEQDVQHHQVMADNVPVYEEQEIAYPALTTQHEDEDHSFVGIPTWHHTTTTTERPTVQQVPVWHQTQAPAVVPLATWQHVPTTTKPTPQETPVWHFPQNNGKPQQTEGADVPVWQQTAPIEPVSVTPTTAVSESVPVAVPVPAPPQHEMPVPIFPDIHFDEAEAIADQQDNDDVGNDHFLVGGVQHIAHKPKPTKRPVPQVEVIEQYHHVNPNGTQEYKLVLSNGMTNYKKIYNKLLPTGKIVTVQEGYDSVPIPGDDPYSNDYQVQFYIADEFGHNVYRIEKHTRRPKFPTNLDYKEQAGVV